NDDRKLDRGMLFVRLMTVKRKLHLWRSARKRLSSPTLTSNKVLGLTRVGLRSTSNAGPAMLSNFAPVCVGLAPQMVPAPCARGCEREAVCMTPPAATQKSPMAVC